MEDRIDIIGLEEKYLQHTNYHLFPGGRKRLRVIVGLGEWLSGRLLRRINVLDVGCGNGSISFPVASLGHHLLGIDISQESVDYAGSRNPFTNARFKVHNLADEPLGEKFDLIICSEVLEHLENPGPLVQAMAGGLEPGGLLVITVPNGYGPREVLGRFENHLRQSAVLYPLAEGFRRLFRMSSASEKCQMHTSNPDQDHVQKFTPKRLKDLIESNGLRVAEWVNSFWLFSLFGPAKKGTNPVARFDSWLADLGPAICSSGWYVVCQKSSQSGCWSPLKDIDVLKRL
jgi:2-polyprenyl-3-methyl-5-hydroxy-6-metoxy-1,4-benzoquinol methylase